MAVTKTIPVLVYRDIAAAHRFLVDVFGFDDVGLDHSPEGTVIHGEVRAGGTTIWLHREVDEFHLASPQSLPNLHGGLVVQLDDLDAHHARVAAAGAADREPTDMPYGQREYEAHDPEGHVWWFAQPNI
jgi:MerR family transcriptional regulator, thiopeptide resistance regulator